MSAYAVPQRRDLPVSCTPLRAKDSNPGRVIDGIQVHWPIPLRSAGVNSPSDLRPQPSAMLAPIDAEARRIWLVRPYISSLGKTRLSRYTCSVSSCDFSQTFSSFKYFIRPPRLCGRQKLEASR